MPIKDILADGGKEPRTVSPETAKPPSAKSLKDRYVDAMGDGIELRGLQAGLGTGLPGEKPPDRKIEDEAAKTGLQMLGSIIDNALKQSQTEAAEARSTAREAHESRLALLQEQIVEARSGPSPIENFKQINELMKEYAASLKSQLGIPSEHVGAMDIPGLLALENLKLEREERRHQWDVEMEERRQQWKREDRRWEEEFTFKRSQWQAEHQGQEKALDSLTDLASSVVDAIDTEKGVGDERSEAKDLPPKDRKPKAFTCEKCGEVVLVPSQEATDVTCKKCGEVYDLVAQ